MSGSPAAPRFSPQRGPSRCGTPSWSRTRATTKSTRSAIGLRASVEAGRRRQDHGADARELQHVLEMHRGERRFARHEHQRAALLQHHVGGALDQVVGEPVRDRAERAHRARADRHRVGRDWSPTRPARSSRRAPNTVSWPSGARKRAARLRVASRGCAGSDEVAFLLRDDLRRRRIERGRPGSRAASRHSSSRNP